MVDDIHPRQHSANSHTPQTGGSPVKSGDVAPHALFKPPETVAETEAASGAAVISGHHGTRWWHKLSKKQWIIIAAVAVVLLGGAGTTFALLHNSKPTSVAVKTKPKAVKPVVKPAPVPLVSTLTGLPITDASVNNKPVTAVMIENSTDARPQSGLDQAGVVFEAVAEGGITRFVALFQDSAPAYVGPVRSVRPYYLQWLMGFDAAVAHVGGSPEAISDIKNWGTKNLDQEYNGSFFHRITSRFAPHNVYTSLSNLNALEAKLGYGKSNYTAFLRKPDAPSKTPNASSIDFNISGFYYNVHYDYDAATNTYKRSEAGKPHMEVDEAGKQTQIAPKVVVAMVMPQGIEADDLHSSYNTIGSGQAFVFQDGVVTQGTWHKASTNENFTFTDANNQPLKFNAGQTWLTALGAASRVTYK